MSDAPVLECEATLLGALECAVADGRWLDAECLVDAFLASHLAVHDGYRNLIARLLTWVCAEFGEQELGRLNEAHGSWKDFKPAVTLPPRKLVQRIADINHWHLTRFRIVEDDAKVTFLLQPCGSGGRLINEGRYYATGAAPYALVHRPSASTFAMPDFPVYCNHCSEMSRTILQGGAHGWIIEGWTADHRWGGCRLHVYKSYELVDREFFDRLALTPPASGTGKRLGRLFSAAELRDLSVSAPEHLRECIITHNATAAAKRLRQARASWVEALRPAYRLWAGNILLKIHRQFGWAAFTKVVRETAWELLSRALEVQRSPESWAAFWRETGALRAVHMTKESQTLTISLADLFTDELRPLIMQGDEDFKVSFAEFLSRQRSRVRLKLCGDAVLSFRVGTP